MASHDSLVGFAYIFQVIVYPSHNRSWITPAVLILVYAPINVNPEGGGSGKGWGFDIFTKKNVKCHSLGRKYQGKIPHPRDEIVFLKYLVSGALYMLGDREITQIHLAV
jgi:hypothetical protein